MFDLNISEKHKAIIRFFSLSLSSCKIQISFHRRRESPWRNHAFIRTITNTLFLYDFLPCCQMLYTMGTFFMALLVIATKV